MKINNKTFQILNEIKDNKLTPPSIRLVEESGYIGNSLLGIKLAMNSFVGVDLAINYISSSIHHNLIDTQNFIKAKSLLKSTPESTGLLLLPETIYPDFSALPDYLSLDPQDYPINSILYTWRSYNNLDRFLGDFDPNNINYEDNEGRELFILPFYNKNITQATSEIYMRMPEDLYGDPFSEKEGNCWYGNIHNYVISFLLFYNFTKMDSPIETVRRPNTALNEDKCIDESMNHVEIIDSRYFTKQLVTDGSEVNSSYFKFQLLPAGSFDNLHNVLMFIER